jgi:hypothetical protein
VHQQEDGEPDDHGHGADQDHGDEQTGPEGPPGVALGEGDGRRQTQRSDNVRREDREEVGAPGRRRGDRPHRQQVEHRDGYTDLEDRDSDIEHGLGRGEALHHQDHSRTYGSSRGRPHTADLDQGEDQCELTGRPSDALATELELQVDGLGAEQGCQDPQEKPEANGTAVPGQDGERNRDAQGDDARSGGLRTAQRRHARGRALFGVCHCDLRS